MRHPTEGVLRRLLDEPPGVAVADRAHVDGCAHCRAELDAMRDDARLVGASLANDAADRVDVAAAWHRLSTAPPAAGVARPPRARRVGAFLRRPSVAGVAFAVVVGGAGIAAANDWLPIFRTQRVEPVSITTGDLVALPDLSAYGTLVVSRAPNVREVPDAAAAKAETGLDVPRVTDLPRGVAGDPTYSVGAKVSATFTFSAERAARAVTATGAALPPVPPGLDGSSVRLDAGPGVAQVWRSSAGAPALVVGRAVAPAAYSSGAPFETVRDYLLSLPGLPDGVAAQLRSFTADGATFPLPVPADQVVTTTTAVDGVRATVLRTRDRSLAAVVWVDRGILNVVAGAFDTDELLAVAREVA